MREFGSWSGMIQLDDSKSAKGHWLRIGSRIAGRLGPQTVVARSGLPARTARLRCCGLGPDELVSALGKLLSFASSTRHDFRILIRQKDALTLVPEKSAIPSSPCLPIIWAD